MLDELKNNKEKICISITEGIWRKVQMLKINKEIKFPSVYVEELIKADLKKRDKQEEIKANKLLKQHSSSGTKGNILDDAGL